MVSPCALAEKAFSAAPYRETREEAELFRREGVLSVDIESASVFAAARVRGCDAASILVIGDRLTGPRWAAPPDMRALRVRFKGLLDGLLQSLAGMDD